MPPKFGKTRIPNRVAPAKVAARVQQLFAQGFALHQQGRLALAQACYEQVLEMQPGNSNALHMLGGIACQTKQFNRAVDLIGKAIEIDPGNAAAYFNRGTAFQELRQLDAAVQSYDKAVALKPDFAAAYSNRGIALQELKQFDAAVQSYDKAIALKPDLAEAYSNRGNALRDLKRLDAAVQSYDKAVAHRPGYAEAHYNRGNALRDLKQLDAAVQSYDRALALKPDLAEACSNRGQALAELRQLDAALLSCDRAIALKPDYAEAYSSRGFALAELKQLDAALQSFDRAIALKPDFSVAHANRGMALQELKQFDAAVQSYDKAIALNPHAEFLYGMRLHAKMRMCDWRDVDVEFARLSEKLERSEKACPPFYALAITDSPSLQRKAAEIWVQDKFPPGHALAEISGRVRHDKMRIGYFSADFRDHAVSHLTAELFERHDRTRFDLIGFSLGPAANDAMRTRVAAAFDQFIDVRARSDRDVALLSRALEVDIAVDLGGFTADNRTEIFAMRAAPLQVSYIGYLGTMGAEYIDYLIADSTIIPREHQQYYAEKIICLPSYQANDSKKRIAEKRFTREELGLPQNGFVYCCFNNNYKITPTTFDGWMRILRHVDDSVLFLYADNDLAASNLQKEAVQRGVDAGRLIFGKQLPMPEYLSRYRAADLFLDTLPYNGGATASDALWAGLPVLTCIGETFAGRVAASLLNAIHLPELITRTQEEYEALAVDLASNRQRLNEIRQKLENNRLTAPLFDTPLFARHIEAAYTTMYERYRAGLPPDHVYVEP